MLPPGPTRRDRSRLAKLLGIAEALPAFEVRSEGRHRGFRIRGKTFAGYLYDHHGDGMVAICCKSTRERQRALVASDPETYFVPSYVGRAGWVGIRLDLARVDWEVVAEMLFAAYRLQAPRRLATLVELPHRLSFAAPAHPVAE